MREVTVAALVVVAIGLSGVTASAQEGERRPTRWGLGTDAAAWAFSGYSALATVEPGATPHWRWTAEVWGFEFPEAYIELNDENAGEGWKRRVDVAVALFMDYQFDASGEGLHVGALLNTFRSTVSRDAIAGEASFWSVELLGRVGYWWSPFSGLGLYVAPWLGGGPLVGFGEPEVGGERYDEAPLQLVGTLHVGWRL